VVQTNRRQLEDQSRCESELTKPDGQALFVNHFNNTKDVANQKGWHLIKKARYGQKSSRKFLTTDDTDDRDVLCWFSCLCPSVKSVGKIALSPALCDETELLSSVQCGRLS